MSASRGRRGRQGGRALVAAAVLAAVTGSGVADADVRAADDSCPAGLVPEDGMTDVPDSNVHEAAVDCLVWWDVARGTGPGAYSPQATVSRAQMASFLVRALLASGAPLDPAAPDAFGDDTGSTHEASINALAAAGVVGGTGAGRYSPADVVSRAQMATFLVRSYEQIIGEPVPAAGDAFGDDDGGTHEANIDRAAALGFTGGTSATTYSPSAPVRRDAMASFLTRMLDAAVEEGYAVPPGGGGLEPPPPPPSGPGGPPGPPPSA